jgi:hypothetical protein
MGSIHIKESVVSPKTVLNKDLGVFEISGNSYMSNPVSHYNRVLDWLKEYVKDPLPETNFVFNLEYVNSATIKLLNEIIRVLLKIKETNKGLEILWYYNKDDEDCFDVGKQFEALNKFPFKFVKK